MWKVRALLLPVLVVEGTSNVGYFVDIRLNVEQQAK